MLGARHEYWGKQERRRRGSLGSQELYIVFWQQNGAGPQSTSLTSCLLPRTGQSCQAEGPGLPSAGSLLSWRTGGKTAHLLITLEASF